MKPLFGYGDSDCPAYVSVGLSEVVQIAMTAHFPGRIVRMVRRASFAECHSRFCGGLGQRLFGRYSSRLNTKLLPHHSPPWMANDDKMMMSDMIRDQTNGIQVETRKYPAS